MLRLTPEDANAISEIECLLTFRETGKDLVLGTDNKLTRDWEGNEVKGEKFTLTEEPYIEDTALPAGDYIYYFRLKAPTMNLYSPKAWSSRWTRPPRQLESTDITALLQILRQGDFIANLIPAYHIICVLPGIYYKWVI